MEISDINKNPTNCSEKGSIKIADEVVGIIAGLAATEVDGVGGMSGGIAEGIAGALGLKNLSKGVKVDVGETQVEVNLFLIVNYGVRIPEVAWNVQEKVKEAIENMTGLKVEEINIHVQGVNFGQSSKDEDIKVKKQS